MSRSTFVSRSIICSALIFSLSTALFAALPAQIPRGVFSLPGAGAKSSDAALQNPNVDGISIRQDWSELEPSENVYDWTYLDSEVARAAAAGKSILLRINTQNHKPAWVTEAVTKAGGTFVTFSDVGDEGVTIPVFWDPTFLAKKKAMITALGAHFKNNPAVKVVWASFANAKSEDWNVPDSDADVAIWQSVGYTSAKMLDAGKQIIDTTMAAFPNQYVTIAVSGNSGGLDPTVDYVESNAVATAKASWPGRLIVQKNSLSAFYPHLPGTGTVCDELWDNRPAVAGQMLDSCYGDTTYRDNHGVADDFTDILKRSVDIAVGYEMNYVEIYQTDVINLPDAIAYAHNALVGASAGNTAPKAPTGLSIKR